MLTPIISQTQTDSTILANTDVTVLAKSIQIGMQDPHGLQITLISVAAVFLGLLTLILAYTLIGKIINYDVSRQKNEKKEPQERETAPSPKEVAAITTALHLHLDENIHDQESYTITIKRRQ